MNIKLPLKSLVLVSAAAAAIEVNMLYNACYTSLTHTHTQTTILYYDIYLTERTNTFVCTATSTIVASLATLYQTAPD
jgi:hypothetical protein